MAAALVCAWIGGGWVESAAAEAVTIMAIQGAGHRSPLQGRWVRTEGVVTVCTRRGHRCWIQDPDGDGDTATSDGLALELKRSRTPRLRPGDRVRAHGRVRERRFGAALSHTSLDPVRSIQIQARNQPLPPPRPLRRLPDESIPAAIAFWEPLEGMRVRVAEARVVGPTSRHGEFVVVAAENARPGSGFHAAHGYLLVRPLAAERVDYNPERILVGATTRKRPLQVRVGDRVRNLTGVVDYSYGNYKIQPQALQPRRAAMTPPPALSPTAGLLAVATFNLENLFDDRDDPGVDDPVPTAADLDIQLRKLAQAVERGLGLPAIVAVQEVENTAVLQRLAERINASAGTHYRAASFDSSDGRGIEVGVLWDRGRVSLLEAEPLAGAAVARAFGRRGAGGGREPLKAIFRVGAQTLTLLVVHFKSKGGDEPLFGRRQPPRRVTEVQRRRQARAVRDEVDRLLQTDPDALVAVAGDVNDFPFAEPGEGAEHALAILSAPAGGAPLHSVLEAVPEAQRFTYVYQGNAQVLDYILVSPALRRALVSARALPINAGFPDVLGDDAATYLRSSDHDPLAAEFRLSGP